MTYNPIGLPNLYQFVHNLVQTSDAKSYMAKANWIVLERDPQDPFPTINPRGSTGVGAGKYIDVS